VDSKIKELSLAIATMDLDELVEGHRRRLLILDSQIEALRQLETRLDERMTVLDDLAVKLGALVKIDSLVLRIIDTGEKEEVRT